MTTLKLYIWRDPDPYIGEMCFALAYSKDQAIALLERLEDKDLTIFKSHPCEIVDYAKAFHEYTDM